MITNLRMELFEALGATHRHGDIRTHGDIFATQGEYADYLLQTDDPLSASTRAIIAELAASASWTLVCVISH